MITREHDYESLAFRAGRGDREAGATLKRQLEPQLMRIVRHTLKTGRDTNPLAQRVLAEARKVSPTPSPESWTVSDSFVAQIAKRLCDTLVAGLAGAVQPRQWLVDTVANAS